MKKGFLFTLIAIAFAFVQVTNTYATAPIVSDPGDIIIGDIEGATNPATGTNIFVYPDAFNLDDIVSDDATDDDDIKWSFVDASGTITINGAVTLDADLSGLNDSDPTSPRASSRVDLNDDSGSGTSGSDSDMGTVTFRNASFTDGDPFAQTTITLYASDCSTFSSKSIVVYTIDNTSDAISGTSKETIIGQIDFTMGTAASNGWAGGVVTNASGSSATDGDSGNGLCMTASATTGVDESGWFTTANPYWDLADNTVYCITLDVTSDQTTPGAQPFWNLNVTNLANLYGTDYWVIDIDGGANAIQPGGSTMRYAWTPASVGMPRWIAALGVPANDVAVDPALLIRVIDGNPAIGFAADSGTICITGLRIEAISRDAIAVEATEEDGALDPSTHFAENATEAGSGSTPTFPAGGPMTFNPNTTGDLGGGTNDSHTFAYFDQSLSPNFSQALNPIVQQSQTLYRVQIGAVATSGTDIADGPDFLAVNGVPTASTEFAVSSFVTRGAAGPLEGVTSPGATPGVYEAYLFVQAATTSATVDNDRMNFFGQWQNTTTLFGDGNGADDVDVTSLTMQRLANIFN